MTHEEQPDFYDAALNGGKVAITGVLTDNPVMAHRGLKMICQGGLKSLLTACLGWARSIQMAADMNPDLGNNEMIGFEVLDEDETPVNPDQVPEEMASAVWAARFVAATANQDFDQCSALFSEALRLAEARRQCCGGDHILALVELSALQMAARTDTSGAVAEAEAILRDE